MKLRNILFGTALLGGIVLQSCRDDFDYDPISTGISFNRDTLSVDTVFNHRKSETYVLKIYNNDKDNKVIPKIYLNKGNNSFFQINVDGRAGKDFENVAIRGRDSLFVFVEIQAKDAPNNPLYDDELIVETTSEKKQVKLLSWIEKANFLKDQTIGSASWDANTAQVISGNVTVQQSLNISAGSKVYFEKDAQLTINDNAQFTVEGNVGNFVKFRSARHDSRYDSLPNQWNKIELKPRSTSVINYAKIIGGQIGLEVNQAKLDIRNSYVVNHQSFGVLANNAEILGVNLLMNNANNAALALTNGGKYAFYHSTFANYFSMIGTAGPAYALYLSNADLDEQQSNPLTQAIFANSIFYSDRSANGIAFHKNEAVAFSFLFDTNMMNNLDTSTLNMTSTPGFTASILGDPLFTSPYYTSNNLRLEEDSPAIGKGKSSYATQYPLDIFGMNRTASPNLGAIQ